MRGRKLVGQVALAACRQLKRGWREDYPLGLIWWMVFWPVELVFVGGILGLHQLVLHSWVSWIGFLNSWSVSFVVLYGDTVLSMAVATLATLMAWLHRREALVWPAWLNRRLVQAGLLLASAAGTSWWILALNRRPTNFDVRHNLAWLYDSYHVICGSLVTWVLANGLLVILTVARHNVRSRDRFKLLLVPGLIGLYFLIVGLDRPAIRFETGVVVSSPRLEWVQQQLFTHTPLLTSDGSDTIKTTTTKPNEPGSSETTEGS